MLKNEMHKEKRIFKYFVAMALKKIKPNKKKKKKNK